MGRGGARRETLGAEARGPRVRRSNPVLAPRAAVIAAPRMCGRTSCHLSKEVLARACAYRDRQGQRRLPEWRDPDRLKLVSIFEKAPQYL